MKRPSYRILLVEDEAILALAQRHFLTLRGYAVDRAATGEEAVGLFIGGENYDIVVTDVDLGLGIDGIEAAKRILKSRIVPILFSTSLGREELGERTEGMGNYGFVPKHAESARLLETIELMLGPVEAETSVGRSQAPIGATSASLPIPSLGPEGKMVL